MCRHLSKGDKTTPSTNSHIHKEDFPTCFDTALKVANIVHRFPANRPFSFLMDSPRWAHLHGIHFWWPVLHGLYFWYPIFMRDPLLVARSSWAALLVPHLFTGSTSGGPFFMGCTSGTPSSYETHFWWLVLHRAALLVPLCYADFAHLLRYHLLVPV